jgi:DnaJ-class molecular chaperone
VSVEEAINGVKKVVELDESPAKRRISVRIPPGVRTGSVVHLQSRRKQREELVVIIRVAPHPYISMHVKGLVVEVPITVQEAVEGARIQVPTLEEPALITVPAGSQSGHEIRLRSRGPVGRDGVRSDLFYRLLIKVPDQPFASGLAGKVREVSAYYEEAVRRSLPHKLFQSS